MNQLVNPFQQADALDEVLLDVAALIELSPRDRRTAEKKSYGWSNGDVRARDLST